MPEHGTDVVPLCDRRFLIKLVFHKRANHGCGVFRFQSNGVMTNFECEHLLRNNVGNFSDSSREKLRGLQNGSTNLLVAIESADLARLSFNVLPFLDFRRKSVPCSFDCSNHTAKKINRYYIRNKFDHRLSIKGIKDRRHSGPPTLV